MEPTVSPTAGRISLHGSQTVRCVRRCSAVSCACPRRWGGGFKRLEFGVGCGSLVTVGKDAHRATEGPNWRVWATRFVK